MFALSHIDRFSALTGGSSLFSCGEWRDLLKFSQCYNEVCGATVYSVRTLLYLAGFVLLRDNADLIHKKHDVIITCG
jgi:hypothetical protein